MNPHLFRDCAATTIALNDPEHVLITRDLLGHTTLRTAERYYNLARSVEAARAHQKLIRSLRRRAPVPRAST
jgi:integrase